MTLSLHFHERQYGISACEGMGIALTGIVLFGGMPFAMRHWEMAQSYKGEQKSVCLKHKAIAVLLALPALGTLVAIIMKIVDLCKTKTPLGKPEEFSPDNRSKMLGNMHEQASDTLFLHRSGLEANDKGDRDPFITQQDLPKLAEIQRLDSATDRKPFKFAHGFACNKGQEKKMEGAHSFLEFNEGVFAAVFDGTNGNHVAKYANAEFKKWFPRILKIKGGNVQAAFTSLTNRIHDEVLLEWKNPSLASAVMTYIDPNGLAFTNTIGGCEANIYRSNGGLSKTMAIPLSIHGSIENIGSEDLDRRIRLITVSRVQVHDTIVLRSRGAIFKRTHEKSLADLNREIFNPRHFCPKVVAQNLTEQVSKESEGGNISNLVIRVS